MLSFADAGFFVLSSAGAGFFMFAWSCFDAGFFIVFIALLCRFAAGADAGFFMLAWSCFDAGFFLVFIAMLARAIGAVRNYFARIVLIQNELWKIKGFEK
jgi:hypothetical protein